MVLKWFHEYSSIYRPIFYMFQAKRNASELQIIIIIMIITIDRILQANRKARVFQAKRNANKIIQMNCYSKLILFFRTKLIHA